jgi:hypothetical protein
MLVATKLQSIVTVEENLHGETERCYFFMSCTYVQIHVNCNESILVNNSEYQLNERQHIRLPQRQFLN